MTIHLGKVVAGSTLYVPFHTFNSNGGSVTITGLAASDIEIYKNGSTTQRSSDNGYTLLDTDGIDFDGITGLHGFSIDLSDNSDSGFYSAGGFYWVVISTITVDGQTVTFVAATFQIEPTAEANIRNSFDDTAGPVPWLGILDQGTAQAASSTTLQLRSAATFGDDTIVGAMVMARGSDQGYWQCRTITDYVGSTDTATVDTWQVTPTGTITYKIFAAPPASASAPPAVNVTQWGGSAVNSLVSGRVDASVGAMAANVVTASAIASDAITDAKVASDVTIASVTGAVGSVTGAVGSVTGNVGGNVVGSVA